MMVWSNRASKLLGSGRVESTAHSYPEDIAMTAVRRSGSHDPGLSPSAKVDHVGGDVLVAVVFLTAFLVFCLFALASFVVGCFGR